MKNLAGVKEADEYIQEELILAGIPLIKGGRNAGEVPYSITGKLGDWTFGRAWYYWVASSEKGNGLPLEIATALHERNYPIIGEKQPKTYGQIIRVMGDCTCPHPREWALPNRETLDKALKTLGRETAPYCELITLLNTGKIQGPRFVEAYHIDNQLGLNEFARVIRD